MLLAVESLEFKETIWTFSGREFLRNWWDVLFHCEAKDGFPNETETGNAKSFEVLDNNNFYYYYHHFSNW